MNTKLQNKLFIKYPKIFSQINLPITETSMCWGIECNDGWYWLIDMLCQQLQYDIDVNDYPQIEAVQIKEKFGTLRFYTNYANTEQHSMIRLAEFLSCSICEVCGSFNAETMKENDWISTLCEKCRKGAKK